MSPFAVGLCAALAAALITPSAPRPATGRVQGRGAGPGVSAGEGWLRRGRVPLSLFAGLAAALLVTGPLRLPAALGAGGVTWVLIAGSESPRARRERLITRHDLPHLVGLLAEALRAGQAPAQAVEAVTAALPGPASRRLAPIAGQLRMGVDPTTAWEALAGDEDLAPLGRAVVRALTVGAPILTSVERLADGLAAGARSEVEDRARAVGVRAAVPLGLCLLPSFVVLGIVPLVAGMVGSLGL